MKNPSRASLLFLALFTGGLLVWSVLHAVLAAPASAAAGAPKAASPTALPVRPILEAPSISPIDSPTPSCVRPKQGTNVCYMNWSYIYENANPNYVISMTVAIDGQQRGHYQGFFQTSMYVPPELLLFRVPCGVPGASGDPDWGLSHSFVLKARDTGGDAPAANYGTVFCPSDQVPLASASLNGPALGKPEVSYSFAASLTPITTTLPVTYTWQVTDHPVRVETGGLNDSQNYSWDSYGPKTVQVTISNPVSSQVKTHTILIQPYPVYLPFLRK